MTPGARPQHRAALLLAGVLPLGALLGCEPAPTTAPAPSSRPASTPVAPPDVETSAPQADKEPLRVGQVTPVEDPVRLHQLQERYPDAQALPRAAGLTWEGALNLERAPCEPCWEDRRSIAACLLDAPAGCENLDRLARRTLRLAAAGSTSAGMRAVVTYSEPWSPVPAAEAPLWPDPAAQVAVELWVDPSWGPWVEAARNARDLSARAEQDPLLVQPGFQVRLFPTWTRRDESPGVEAVALHRAVAAADLQGRGVPYLLALDAHGDARAAAAATPGLDLARWQADLDGAAVQARLELDAQAAQAMDLRSAPSWRMDGYRLRGHQRLASLVDRLQNESVDHLPTLPQELLELGAPPVGAAPTGAPAP